MAGKLGTAPTDRSLAGRGTRGPLLSATRTCAELALRYIEARLKGQADAIAMTEGEFKVGACDPAWLTTVNEYMQYFGPSGGRREIPYVRPSVAGERSIEIKNAARVALIADWGTGATPAISVMKQIKNLSPDMIIHLGDVYYSGTPKEYQKNFLGPIDAAFDGKRSPGYILSGNHDMYCGGIGFYSVLGELNADPYKQSASFFCLRTRQPEWQLLPVDTGLNDFKPLDVHDSVTSVREDEVEWLLRNL
jgi:hypothetical protein